MTPPVLSTLLPGGAPPLADDLYEAVEPLAGDAARDAAAGWPLGHFVVAVVAPAVLADAVAEDPALLFDVDGPDGLLVAVEQARGQVVDVRSDPALRRDRLRRRASERFGRPAEIRAAVAETLTDPATAHVRLVERHDPARPDVSVLDASVRFHLTVVTRVAETPDPGLTARSAQDAAPMRTLVHHVLSTGRTVDELTGSIDDLVGHTDDL